MKPSLICIALISILYSTNAYVLPRQEEASPTPTDALDTPADPPQVTAPAESTESATESNESDIASTLTVPEAIDRCGCQGLLTNDLSAAVLCNFRDQVQNCRSNCPDFERASMTELQNRITNTCNVQAPVAGAPPQANVPNRPGSGTDSNGGSTGGSNGGSNGSNGGANGSSNGSNGGANDQAPDGAIDYAEPGSGTDSSGEIVDAPASPTPLSNASGSSPTPLDPFAGLNINTVVSATSTAPEQQGFRPTSSAARTDSRIGLSLLALVTAVLVS